MSGNLFGDLFGKSVRQATAQAVRGATQYAQHQTAGPNDGPSEYTITRVEPLKHKVDDAIARLVRQMPMNVAANITTVSVRFKGPLDIATVAGCRFIVAFVGGKTIEFPLDDAFPTDADVARICLECP